MNIHPGRTSLQDPTTINRHGASRRTNNFDFLRQLAAFLVIVGHSQALLGRSPYPFWGVSVSTFGVQIFFAISGYLVADSWVRDPRVFGFFKKRSLRIFPALIVCVLLAVLVLGPAMTTLSPGDYLSDRGLRHYLNNIILYPVYALPGVFEKNIYPSAVNGSLWSLPVEFACYIGVPLLALGLRQFKPVPLLVLGAVLAVIGNYVLVGREPIVVWGTLVSASCMLMPFFAAGSTLALLKHRFPPHVAGAVVCVLVMVGFQALLPAWTWTVAWVAVTYLVIWLGTSSTPLLRRFGRFGDPSYGMYLYAFPVQQTIIALSGNTVGLGWLIGLTTLFSAMLGFISWYGVERLALRLK